MGSRVRLAAAVIAALSIGACSGGGATPDVGSGASDDGVADGLDGTAPTTTGPYTSPDDIPGVITSQFNLLMGACFDTVELTVGDGIEEQWTVLPCREPHEFEVYHVDTFPAGPDDPWPGDDLFDDWGRQQCYRAFEGFVGLRYELSEFRIGFIRPTEANFTHPIARYRTLTCYLVGPGGERVEGSAAGSAR